MLAKTIVAKLLQDLQIILHGLKSWCSIDAIRPETLIQRAVGVSEEDVARQGGVFMLFYERDASLSLPPPKAATAPAAEEQQSAPSSTEPPAEIASAASLEKPSLTEEAEDEPAPLVSLAEPDEPAAVNPSESSTGATTEDESEADVDEQQPQEAAKPIPIPAAQPRMRTARVDSVGEPGFGSPHRAVAAS